LQRLYLIGCAVVAALGGFLFGFDTAVISGAEPLFQTYFGLSDSTQGFVVSSALIGTIIGAAVMGKPADWYGRRLGLLILAILFFISAIGCALATNAWMLVAFRFIGGLGVGGAAVVSPLYVSEISPAKHRGTLVAVTQLNIVVGILAAYLSNYLISQTGVADAIAWRWMFGIEGAPAALFGALLLVTPESPRWLVRVNRLGPARDALNKLGTDTGDIETELSEIEKSLASYRQGLRETLFQLKYLKPILLAIAIGAFNQLSGINAVLYYSVRIFESAGAGQNAGLLQSVGLGVVNLIVTVAAMTVIDRFGRRKLMLAGSVGYIISLLTIAGTFFVYGGDFDTTGGVLLMVALMVFIGSHAFGQGAVIWVFISEIFPNEVRAAGQSVGVFTHWFMNWAITLIFPWFIGQVSGWAPFVFFGAMMILQLLWVIFIMPETKGVPLERVKEKLGIRDAEEPVAVASEA
jgi:sugar porter (SP) family MFS transporter